MLNLTRRPGEQIQIGDDVVVTFLGFGRGRNAVRLGIEAPRDTLIVRAEIADAKEDAGDEEESSTD